MGRFKKEERATRNLEYWIEANQRTIEMARKIFQKVTCLDMIWHKVPHFSVQHLNNLQSSHWSPQSKQSRMKKCLVVYLLCASSWPEVSNVWFFVKGWFRLHYSPVSGTAPFMSISVTPILEFLFQFVILWLIKSEVLSSIKDLEHFHWANKVKRKLQSK